MNAFWLVYARAARPAAAPGGTAMSIATALLLWFALSCVVAPNVGAWLGRP